MESSKPFSPSSFDASSGFAHNAAASVTEGLDRASDAAHQALKETKHGAQAAADWATDAAATIDRRSSDAMQAFSQAVTRRPLVAVGVSVGVAVAVGYLLGRATR